MAFVTAQEVIDKAFTNAQTDVALIKSDILEIAEFAHLRPIMGKDFYDDLKGKFDNGTLGTKETTLVNTYIKEAMAYFVKYEVMPDLMWNTASLGIRQNIDDFSDPISMRQLNVMREATYRHAQALVARMIDYLEDNKADFDEYDGDETRDVFMRSGIVIVKRKSLRRTTDRETG